MHVEPMRHVEAFRAEADRCAALARTVPHAAPAAAAARPDTACPNFAERDDGTLGWWPRHQAHETLLHRWDLESATGQLTTIDPTIAAATVVVRTIR